LLCKAYQHNPNKPTTHRPQQIRLHCFTARYEHVPCRVLEMTESPLRKHSQETTHCLNKSFCETTQPLQQITNIHCDRQKRSHFLFFHLLQLSHHSTLVQTHHFPTCRMPTWTYHTNITSNGFMHLFVYMITPTPSYVFDGFTHSNVPLHPDPFVPSACLLPAKVPRKSDVPLGGNS
jgi:hypothetical protein